jgi:tRNA(Ile)-lysidine synthase
VTDSTNLIDEYARNKIRLSIMPVFNEINEGAVDHIVEIAGDLSRLAKETESEVCDLLNNADYISRKKNVRMENVKEWGDEGREIEKEVCDSISIPIDRLKEMSSFAAGDIILKSMENVCGRRKDITRKHINSVAALADKDTGKHVDLPYDMFAERGYDSIIISRNSFNDDSFMDIYDGTLKGHIEISRFPYSEGTDISKKEYTKMVDCDKIKSVPVLRTMKKDDYIVVNNEGGTKKLSRFLSAEKIDKSLRSSIPVVADGDEIIWVVGYRLSERYKVTPNTKTVMRMDYISGENNPSS